MEVKLSQEEVKAIAAEVVKQLGKAGSSLAIATPSGTQTTAKPGRGRKKSAPAEPVTQTAAPATAQSTSGGGPYSIASAAEAAGQHPNTIRRHVQSGLIKSKTVKGSYQISQRDFDKYLRSK